MDIVEGESCADFLSRLEKAIKEVNPQGFVHPVPEVYIFLPDPDFEKYTALGEEGRPIEFELLKNEPVLVIQQMSILDQLGLKSESR